LLTGEVVAGRVSAERLARDVEAVAGCSECVPDQGFSRPTFSAPWGAVCRYVIDEATRAGCSHRIDAHGNVHIRPAGTGWEKPLWLSGSHLDSVPSGGKYDGVTGVVCALELLRCGAELELVVYAEEEGTTFGLGMLGSRSWVGALSVAQLCAVRNREGKNYLEAGEAFGVRPDAMAAERLDPRRYLGFLEVHPEQGLSLWNRGIAVAAVDRINGRRQYTVSLQGQGNHAGSTRMPERRDALAGAAEVVLEVERIGRALAEQLDYTVMTVGRLNAIPNALNVIASQVDLTIDFRAQTQAMLDEGDGRLRARIHEIAASRGLPVMLAVTEDQPPAPLDERLIQRLHRAADACGIPFHRVPSGALHDAAIVAPYLPTAMLFVASRDGISHHPTEFSRIEDLVAATRLIAHAICEPGAIPSAG
jgi:hydantoinase/carbamoylase family amidase